VHATLYNKLSTDAAHGVLANDTDHIPNDALTVSEVNGQSTNVGHAIAGAYGTLTLNTDGSYTYLAGDKHLLPADGVGLDTFTYTTQDGAGHTATTTLTVVVTEPNMTYLGGTALPRDAVQTIIGPNGHNGVLDGGAGNNVLVGGTGQTVLIGGPWDTLTGGNGPNWFVFGPHFGRNVITNFDTNKDVIQLPSSEFGSFADVIANAYQSRSDTLIALPTRDSIVLTGVSLWQLHASDFWFGADPLPQHG
jgi:VCBS repeat-containing protein